MYSRIYYKIKSTFLVEIFFLIFDIFELTYIIQLYNFMKMFLGEIHTRVIPQICIYMFNLSFQ